MKSTLDQRYRHKLNMLEPGCRMLKIAGALGLTGLLLRWAGATMLSRADHRRAACAGAADSGAH